MGCLYRYFYAILVIFLLVIKGVYFSSILIFTLICIYGYVVSSLFLFFAPVYSISFSHIPEYYSTTIYFLFFIVAVRLTIFLDLYMCSICVAFVDRYVIYLHIYIFYYFQFCFVHFFSALQSQIKSLQSFYMPGLVHIQFKDCLMIFWLFFAVYKAEFFEVIRL